MDDYTKVIEFDTENAHSYYTRGEFYKRIGLKAEASIDFCRAVKLFLKQGNVEKAVHVFKIDIKL